ncbi:hypothetical protein RGQ21_41630 [Kitasatospora aureofaciens]|nr:hypothetical protein RGQ21_41630 [Kitasatospora aureofaciens]
MTSSITKPIPEATATPAPTHILRMVQPSPMDMPFSDDSRPCRPLALGPQQLAAPLERYLQEAPRTVIHVPDFRIARTPVTVDQRAGPRSGQRGRPPGATGRVGPEDRDACAP